MHSIIYLQNRPGIEHKFCRRIKYAMQDFEVFRENKQKRRQAKIIWMELDADTAEKN
jgi:hypothetical protein